MKGEESEVNQFSLSQVEAHSYHLPSFADALRYFRLHSNAGLRLLLLRVA
jgi:hypothetical protein